MFLAGFLTLAGLFLFRFYFTQEENLKPRAVSVFASGEAVGSRIAGLQNWLDDFFHFNGLRREIAVLREENAQLINRLADWTVVRNENDLLRAALEMTEETGWSLETARIILTDPSGLTGSFWINRGARDGLQAGMNVVMADKILVGRLEECFDVYCRGQSIFAPETKISVEDIRSSTLAIAEKDVKGNFRLTLVPYESDIQIGDVLVTSSESAGFLKGLLVAKVKKSAAVSEASSLKEFVLDPLINFSQLSSVLIITDMIPSL